MKSILFLSCTLFLSLNSFTFADHDHFLNQCHTETCQEWIDGSWSTQFVPAVYQTIQVRDAHCGRYIQKQVLVTPASYKQVWIPGRYITKTRYICETTPPVCEIKPPVCETSSSFSFNKPLFSTEARFQESNFFENRNHFRSNFELPKQDFRFQSYDFSRKPIQRDNDFQINSRFSKDKGFQFKFKNKRNTFGVKFN